MVNAGTTAYVGLGLAVMIGLNAVVRPFDDTSAPPVAMAMTATDAPAMALRDANGDLTEYGARMMLEKQRQAELEEDAGQLATVQTTSHERRDAPARPHTDPAPVASTGQPASAVHASAAANRAEAERKRREALAAVEAAAQGAAEGQETGAALVAAQGLLRDEEILLIVRRYELRHLEERRERERRHAHAAQEHQRAASVQHAAAAAHPAAPAQHTTSPHPASAHTAHAHH